MLKQTDGLKEVRVSHGMRHCCEILLVLCLKFRVQVTEFFTNLPKQDPLGALHTQSLRFCNINVLSSCSVFGLRFTQFLAHSPQQTWGDFSRAQISTWFLTVHPMQLPIARLEKSADKLRSNHASLLKTRAGSCTDSAGPSSAELGKKLPAQLILNPGFPPTGSPRYSPRAWDSLAQP